MRLDVSSLHPRTPNSFLNSEQLDFDEELLASGQIFLRAEGKSPKTIDGYVQSILRLLAYTCAKAMPELIYLTREHVAARFPAEDLVRSA